MLHERSQTRKEDIPFIKNYRKCEQIYSDKKEIPRRTPWGRGRREERLQSATRKLLGMMGIVACLSGDSVTDVCTHMKK